ncbi:MAG: glutamine--fructose-6-phosphate transaminase (isomerizing) [Clostridia bacterium]|nr:glutamine--fructose-6-phosphate transaminase (isomerizing) [Clostridia bacterium]
MCGIVGFTGKRQALPILLKGLERLEYRGYDSAGVAVCDGKTTRISKNAGRVYVLKYKTESENLVGTCGIGHTRWATHGKATEENAHPHTSEDLAVVAVHNGIIENYARLKTMLVEKGYAFYSQTDTEVAVKWLDYCLKQEGEPLQALSRFMEQVEGSYALAVLFKEYEGEIYAIRKDSPLLVGVANGESFLASDAPAIAEYTGDLYYMENKEIAQITAGEARFYDERAQEIKKVAVRAKTSGEETEKGAFAHFTLKEIFEQPKAVERTINALLKDGFIDFSAAGISEKMLKERGQVWIVACGSAYHAGLVLQYFFESVAKIPTRVELASEFRYRNPLLGKDALVVAISQSGETADTLFAVREAKRAGAETLAIVNVYGSSIAREAKYTLYTQAGTEVAVATTKAYSTQLVAGYLLGVELARGRGGLDERAYRAWIEEIVALPAKLSQTLEIRGEAEQAAKRIAKQPNVFFIGRGVDYATAMEGSLKLKEISYIHAEAYAAGELKHGAISLIETGTPVVCVVDSMFEKTVSNLAEVKARGAFTIAVAGEGKNVEGAEVTLSVPNSRLFASVAVVPLQFLGYYCGVERGEDVDKPRNLAKSVTVE